MAVAVAAWFDWCDGVRCLMPPGACASSRPTRVLALDLRYGTLSTNQRRSLLKTGDEGRQHSSALIDLGVACCPWVQHAAPISACRAPDLRLATGRTRGALCLVSASARRRGSCSCCVPAQVGSGAAQVEQRCAALQRFIQDARGCHARARTTLLLLSLLRPFSFLSWVNANTYSRLSDLAAYCRVQRTVLYSFAYG